MRTRQSTHVNREQQRRVGEMSRQGRGELDPGQPYKVTPGGRDKRAGYKKLPGQFPTKSNDVIQGHAENPRTCCHIYFQSIVHALNYSQGGL